MAENDDRRPNFNYFYSRHGYQKMALLGKGNGKRFTKNRNVSNIFGHFFLNMTCHVSCHSKNTKFLCPEKGIIKVLKRAQQCGVKELWVDDNIFEIELTYVFHSRLRPIQCTSDLGSSKFKFNCFLFRKFIVSKNIKTKSFDTYFK